MTWLSGRGDWWCTEEMTYDFLLQNNKSPKYRSIHHTQKLVSMQKSVREGWEVDEEGLLWKKEVWRKYRIRFGIWSMKKRKKKDIPGKYETCINTKTKVRKLKLWKVELLTLFHKYKHDWLTLLVFPSCLHLMSLKNDLLWSLALSLYKNMFVHRHITVQLYLHTYFLYT